MNKGGRQVRRIEEVYRNGLKGADPSEDNGGLAGRAGKGIEHVGIDKSHIAHACIMEAAILQRH